MALYKDIMSYFDKFIHVYGWNLSVLWYPSTIWTPKSFSIANFRHPVSKSWLRPCSWGSLKYMQGAQICIVWHTEHFYEAYEDAIGLPGKILISSPEHVFDYWGIISLLYNVMEIILKWKNFNYKFEIDILRNDSQKHLGVLRGDVFGFECPKGTQMPCWWRLCCRLSQLSWPSSDHLCTN